MTNAALIALMIRRQREERDRQEQRRRDNRKRRSEGAGSYGSSKRSRSGRSQLSEEDSRFYRQRTELLDIPMQDKLSAFAKAEKAPLPEMPSFDGKPASSIHELAYRAQGIGSHRDISAHDRQRALDGIVAIAEWAETHGNDDALSSRIQESVGNDRFLRDMGTKVSNASSAARSAEWAVLDDALDAYSDYDGTQATFESMIEEKGHRRAYQTVKDDPTVLGNLKGIGIGKYGAGILKGTPLVKIGNEDYRDAVDAQQSMFGNMTRAVEKRDAHTAIEQSYEEAKATRPVERHLVGFEKAPGQLKRAINGREFKRIQADIALHREFEQKLRDDPSAAHAMASSHAKGMDPGGRWEHLTGRAAEAVSPQAGSDTAPGLQPKTPTPAPGDKSGVPRRP
tara:strand:- start:228 stop:1415 length:1188 start_codon:yes stop_codon:yes gene_type:complete